MYALSDIINDLFCLVIMAIIAALCAPNISAYVQAAKVQNYQTVANNLADELQTQLPQSRYWNWDEVQRNAYGILCADAGRCVTLDTLRKRNVSISSGTTTSPIHYYIIE